MLHLSAVHPVHLCTHVLLEIASECARDTISSWGCFSTALGCWNNCTVPSYYLWRGILKGTSSSFKCAAVAVDAGRVAVLLTCSSAFFPLLYNLWLAGCTPMSQCPCMPPRRCSHACPHDALHPAYPMCAYRCRCLSKPALKRKQPMHILKLQLHVCRMSTQ
jgi:hypothetical protein